MEVVGGQALALESSEGELDLGDLVLLGMGETIQSLRILTGQDKPMVDLGDGIEIIIDEQDIRQPWKERLTGLLRAVCDIVDTYPSLERKEVCRSLLKADGWSWTSTTFRTPLWMLDHDEILLPVVVQEFEVLECLEISSLVTR